MSRHKKRSFPLRISPVNVTRKMRIWSNLLKESLMENLFFVKWYVFILIANSSRTPKRRLLDVLWTSCVRYISYIKVQKQTFWRVCNKKKTYDEICNLTPKDYSKRRHQYSASLVQDYISRKYISRKYNPGSIYPGSIYPGSKMGNSCKKILMAKEIELLKHDPWTSAVYLCLLQQKRVLL